MEIIKKGKNKEEMIWTAKFNCTGSGNGGHGCGAELLVSEKDIYITNSYHYDGSSESYRTFTCLCCGAETDIKSGKIPSRLYGSFLQKKEWQKKKKQKEYFQLHITVDAVITVENKDIIMISRKNPPYKNLKVLPGGHLDKNDQNLKQACARELSEEVGLNIDPNELQLLTTLDDKDRDPRKGRRVSVVFTADISQELAKQCNPGSDAKEIHVCDLKSLNKENVGFDHYEAIKLVQNRKETQK